MTKRADIDHFRELLGERLLADRALGVPMEELVPLVALANEVCDELESRRLRPSTQEQLEQLTRIEPLLRTCDSAAARVATVMRKLKVKKTRAYELLGQHPAFSAEKRNFRCETPDPTPQR